MVSLLPPSFLDAHNLSTSSLGCTALWIFLFSDPFIGVLVLSTLRMVLSILRGRQPRYLSFWWDFCYIVWFWAVLSFSWSILFFFFSFISAYLMVSASNIPKYLLVSISQSVLIFLDLVVLFLLSWVIFISSHFSMPNSIPISWLYISLPVLGFTVLFPFWQTVWCRPYSFGDWFFPVIYKVFIRLNIS